MIDIKILGKKYSLPSSREIPLNKFIEFLDFAEQHQPESLRNDEIEKDFIKEAEYYALELEFWTCCPLADLRRHDVEELYSVWAMQQEQLLGKEDKSYNCFRLGKDIYYLPERLMRNSTLEDYAECNEYERQLSEMNNGNFRALAYIVAVLARKQGEMFDDYKHEIEARAEMFANELTAWDAFQVGFFLLRSSVKLSETTRIYTASLTLAQLKQVLKS